jgi:hypothetical protein
LWRYSGGKVWSLPSEITKEDVVAMPLVAFNLRGRVGSGVGLEGGERDRG